MPKVEKKKTKYRSVFPMDIYSKTGSVLTRKNPKQTEMASPAKGSQESRANNAPYRSIFGMKRAS